MVSWQKTGQVLPACTGKENCMIRAGIDIGANSLRLVLENRGVVFDEPCMVVLDKKGNALAIGSRALEMKGMEDEEIRVVSPFAGETVDFEAMDALLEALCYEFKIFRLFQKTILLVSHPTALSSSAVGLLRDHLLSLGAWRVYFDQEIWISAIGAKLDLFLPVGSCVMNIGFSNCDIALFQQGRIAARSSSSANGRMVFEAIASWLRMHHNLLVSEETLDLITRRLGCVRIQSQPLCMEITGQDARTRELRRLMIDENQIAAVLAPLVREWAGWISRFIAGLPLQQKEDILMRGIVSCGGTMKLTGLADTLQSLADCPVYVTDNPVNTVTQGLEILMGRLAAAEPEGQ